MSGTPDVDALRRDMRQRRAQLSPQQHIRSSERVCDLLLREMSFRRARTVGLYCAIAGEIDVMPLIANLWDRERIACLPVIAARGHSMRFHRVEPDSVMRVDRYGIPKPNGAIPVHRREIDLLLVPVVAFDAHGQRMGMGAGYYDRYLAPLGRRERPSRPRVIGCAYDFQEVTQIEAQAWDIPLDAIATEAGVRTFKT